MSKITVLDLPAEIPAEDVASAVNRRIRQICEALNRLANQITDTAAATPGATVAVDTKYLRIENHAPQLQEPGSLLWQKDRSTLYQVEADGDAHLWKYRLGRMRGVLAGMPTDLGANDEGFEYYATDYEHVYRWTGSAWTFGDTDEGSKFFRDFAGTPNKGKWQLCDGSTVNYAKADGTTASFTTPDLTAGVYRKSAAAYTGTVNAATDGTASGSTDAEASHTHSVTIPGETTSGPSATVGAASGGGVTVAHASHAHTTSGGTVSSAAGSSHDHTLSSVTVSGSEPANCEVLTYFRQ